MTDKFIQKLDLLHRLSNLDFSAWDHDRRKILKKAYSLAIREVIIESQYYISRSNSGQYRVPPKNEYINPYPHGDIPSIDNLDIPVANLEVGTRAFTCLSRADIRTVRQLVQLESIDVLKIKNLGRHSFNKIIERLKFHGLSLKDNYENK